MRVTLSLARTLLARRAMIVREIERVEAPDAREARSGGDLAQWQRTLVDEELGKLDAPSLGIRDRRGAQVLLKESAQVAPAHAEMCAQLFDALVRIEQAV